MKHVRIWHIDEAFKMAIGFNNIVINGGDYFVPKKKKEDNLRFFYPVSFEIALKSLCFVDRPFSISFLPTGNRCLLHPIVLASQKQI